VNRLVLALATAAIALVPAATASAGQVRAGAAVLDGTYHVGNSAGQYSSTRDGGYGDVDPHVQQVKNQASYGVASRESVRALVIEGDGNYIASRTTTTSRRTPSGGGRRSCSTIRRAV
jgi:hypothetical protein